MKAELSLRGTQKDQLSPFLLYFTLPFFQKTRTYTVYCRFQNVFVNYYVSSKFSSYYENLEYLFNFTSIGIQKYNCF